LGIYTVELYRKVRLACADGMGKRAAVRHFNISRYTVDKALVFSAPLRYRRTAPIRQPKLDRFTEIIDDWLDGDKDAHSNQRHSAKRMFDRLRVKHGFTGGFGHRDVWIRDHVDQIEIGGRGEVIAKRPRCYTKARPRRQSLGQQISGHRCVLIFRNFFDRPCVLS